MCVDRTSVRRDNRRLAIDSISSDTHAARSGVVRCAEGELECLFPQCVYCRPVDRRTRIVVDRIECRHPLRIERLGIATVQRAVAIDTAEEIETPGTDRTASISSRRACVIAAP